MKLTTLAACFILFLSSCKKKDVGSDNIPQENASLFEEVGMIDIGDLGAAEISAYDPITKRLFVVNNGTKYSEIRKT